MEVHGFVQPGFESVKDAFAANFTSDFEVGASVAVMHRGGAAIPTLNVRPRGKKTH